MVNYNIFAKFYDSVMGDRLIEVDMVKKLILENNPKAKKVLEIACGTGAILKYLSKNYEVYGLDISKGMLSIARERVPQIKLSHQDMRNFKFSEKFDVILCLFDSINHMIKFSDWEKIFLNVNRHLNDGGIFIFDINTEKKLKRLSAERPIVKKFDKNYMIMDVTNGSKRIVNWNIKIFERQKNGTYKLFSEDIKEKSYPIRDIKKSLQKIYSKIEVFDQRQKRPSQNSERAYFVCKK